MVEIDPLFMEIHPNEACDTSKDFYQVLFVYLDLECTCEVVQPYIHYIMEFKDL